MKSWVVGIILLLTLGISAVLYWQSKPKDLMQARIVKEDTLPSEIPLLFPQVSWKEFKESEGYKSLGEQGLYSQGDIYGFIHMSGEEWTASKDNLERDSMDKLFESFTSYYNKRLTELGWSNYYEDELYNFLPLAADGPGGSMWGYIKVRDGKLRVVLLGKFTPIEDFGGRATCPCNVSFRVFVSEAVTLEELHKRTEE